MEEKKPPGITPQPLIIFVLGGPCSGKSTLCRALIREYHLEHFALGDEIRDLVSACPNGRAALIKPTLSAEEIQTFTCCVSDNMLYPKELTCKYVKERLFGAGASGGQVRALVDDFPRDVERWGYLKEMMKDRFNPMQNTFLIVLNVGTELAHSRFCALGKDDDDFDKRFAQHDRDAWHVSNAMKKDGVQILDLLVGSRWQKDPLRSVAEFLRPRMDAWAERY